MRRAQRALAREHGFTIVETLMAGVILLILATGIAGVLTSSIAANTVAHERTVAQQCANDQIEQIRRKAYDNVGLVSGNPPGTVNPTAACGNGLAATATIRSLRRRPTPTSHGRRELQEGHRHRHP
jgi:type II secretory pathway pseudopilin PulG